MGHGPPTHRLVITDKQHKQRRTRAGVAWINEKGWISIVLNPGISINHRDMEELYFLSLYPIDQQDSSHAHTDKPDKTESDDAWADKEIPF